ncbi:hypothetical protein Y88_3184 [Novosphingobium nitrogenifigens DSM 19370]|uniref:DoxX family protein n=1 Tax=Novosphingobium nitrogenifigens DSM 19370 TaxID=983920 RepID=F1ZC06_9SPHN|nr:DoxX family protein [Novosphingobium nitrogenifigens]EGD57857.1 hypothetical protein Y88_3184 [Novosphingobium nitrogenifigens DSM 19370]
MNQPRAIVTLDSAPAMHLLARLCLVAPFAVSGIIKLTDWPGALAEASGLVPAAPASVAALTILVQLLGSALVFVRGWSWLGAGMLAVFTGLATLIAHAFWMTTGPERAVQMNAFLEHASIVGGFILLALVDGIRDGARA